MNLQEYIQEIEKFYLNLKGSFAFLSPKELLKIQKWYEDKIPVDVVKEKIREELSKYPSRKKKNFSLIQVEIKPSNIKSSSSFDKWKKVLQKLNIPDEILNEEDDDLKIEKKVVSYVWKNLPVEERKSLIDEAKNTLNIKGKSKEEAEELIKAYIYNKIKNEIYRLI